MRGQRTLFNDIVTPIAQPAVKTGLGRSKALIKKRDERMLYRYYYYAQIIRCNYADCILYISQQFDLSYDQIQIKLGEHRELLREIIQHKPTVEELSDKYPWLQWPPKPKIAA